MKSRKKIIIGFSIVVAVLLIAIVSLTAVLAAFNAQATGGFNISYTAINVKATVSAQHRSQNDAGWTDVTVGGVSSQTSPLTFDGSEQPGTNDVPPSKSFDKTAITMKKNQHYYLRFAIKNTDSNPIKLSGVVNNFTEGHNLSAYSMVSGSGDPTGLSINDANKGFTSFAASANIVVPANGTKYVVIAFVIDNYTKDVTTGWFGDVQFNFTLSVAA